MTVKSTDTISSSDATPMMAQYLSVKKEYADCLLFYRMGDFYELFFNDAITASAILDITLTKRGAHKGDDIPMCGVPWHAHENYVSRLIKAGHKVAICEQIETPDEAKKRGGYKAVVKRDVVRVITSGTLTEDHLLEKNSNNYLAAISTNSFEAGIALIDLSTGEFILQSCLIKDQSHILARYQIAELLITDQHKQYDHLIADYKSKITQLPSSRFDEENGYKRLLSLYNVKTLEAFGHFSSLEIAAAGAIADYIELTQKGKFPRLSPPKQIMGQDVMAIDAATRRNLELTQTMNGEKKGSLLHAIDYTLSASGGRLLSHYLSSPSTQKSLIEMRLDAVNFFYGQPDLLLQTRQIMAEIGDLERAISRLSLGRGGPRDCAVVKNTLLQSLNLSHLMRAHEIPHILKNALNALIIFGHHHPLIVKLERALSNQLPMLARDGGFINKGYDPKLDELTDLRDNSKRVIATLQDRYIKDTNIQNLKIKHNNILGYFIEVNTNVADQLLSHKIGEKQKGDYIHRQTLATSARFTTVELSELDQKINEAADRALALEQELFADLTKSILEEANAILSVAKATAEIDVFASLAHLAIEKKYVRPTLYDDQRFEIEKGRHPVVENALKKQDNIDFIANHCRLSEGEQLWLLTGPNMAGKSTFLRQNALIALMAHIGSFVPAMRADIGIIDQLFSRVGAADDLARGRSTFMVEMVETAAILNQATEKSLVILDEIGRGTATFDGLSIAWATLEYLHDKLKCRAIFATHYHELTSLSSQLKNLKCFAMRVREWQDQIIFMHEVIAGSADRSYGIHVAKIAGLPDMVVARAEHVLQMLEADKNDVRIKKTNVIADLPLFSDFMKDIKAPKEPSEAEKILKALDVDSLSPKEALELLYRLKQKL